MSEPEFAFESGRWVLRLYIDKQGGVTVGDCERVSRSIEDLLAVEDAIPVSYVLEVSSPGLDRPLRRLEHFEAVLGQQVRVRTEQPIDGRSNFKGTLEAVEADVLQILIDGTAFRVPIAMIDRARLEPEPVIPKGQKH